MISKIRTSHSPLHSIKFFDTRDHMAEWSRDPEDRLPTFLYSPLYQLSSVQSLSRVWLSATPWTAVHQASLSITNSWSLLKLMSIVSVIPFNHLILSSPPALSLSQHQGLFKWVSSSHHVAKVLEFQFQHQSFQWILRMDWLDLLAVQGTLRVFSNTTVQKHQFFGVQLSPILTSLLDYWKTIALTRWTFVGKVMSLFF